LTLRIILAASILLIADKVTSDLRQLLAVHLAEYHVGHVLGLPPATLSLVNDASLREKLFCDSRSSLNASILEVSLVDTELASERSGSSFNFFKLRGQSKNLFTSSKAASSGLTG